ncbi:hypothetical protein D3C81_2104600 [compost metagenome]
MVGIIVTHTYFSFFILKRITVPKINAIAASIWLPTPNSGHKLLMPPSGSTTPW